MYASVYRRGRTTAAILQLLRNTEVQIGETAVFKRNGIIMQNGALILDDQKPYIPSKQSLSCKGERRKEKGERRKEKY
jgi:hypothetical protein